MAQNIRPPKNQHTVTKTVLTQFTDDLGRIAVFERARPRQRRHLVSTGAKVFKTVFDSYDPRGSEEYWNQFENHFPRLLGKLKHRPAAEALGGDADVVRDLMALHWLRSRGIIAARDAIVQRAFGRMTQLNLDSPWVMSELLRQRTGLIVDSPPVLERENAKYLQDFERNSLPKEQSRWNKNLFEVARSRFEHVKLSMRYATDADLAIGDAPVVTTIGGDLRAAGPHQNVGILKADHIAMPITPNALAVLDDDADESDMNAAEVGQYNDLQWSTYSVWIAALPGGFADRRLRSESDRGPS